MTTETDTVQHRTRTNRVPRSRGAISGLLLVLLGAWGALVPFIGPYFDYSYGSDATWNWTSGRGWLEVLPGAVAVVGGLLLITSKNRIRGSLGGWLAALAGAWFLIGRTVATWWHIGGVGEPLSRHESGRAAADLGYFYGLGAVMVFLAAFALGRLAVVGVRDIAAAERDDELAAEQARRDAEIARQRDEQWAEARRLEAERLEAERKSSTTPVATTERVPTAERVPTTEPDRASTSDRVAEPVDRASASDRVAEPAHTRPVETTAPTGYDGPTYDGRSDYNPPRTEDRTTDTGYDEVGSPAGHRPAHTDPTEDGRS